MLSHDEQAAYLDSIERVRLSAASHLGSINHLGSNRNVAIEFVANLHRAVDKVVQRQNTECRPGCACCCSVRVEATEPEIFLIAREIRKLPADQTAAILERLRNHVATPDGARRTDCVFLEDHLCSIYEVRPTVCRRAHSLSVESCKHFAPEIPQNLEILLEADALMKGTSEAYRQVGLQVSAHELGSAVLQALTDGTSEARWCDGASLLPEVRA